VIPLLVEAAEEVDDEAVRVFHWRVRRFLALGFTLRQARVLASLHVEWHTAEKLLEQGCPTSTAFDLLS
jgi:hypothetical protein